MRGDSGDEGQAKPAEVKPVFYDPTGRRAGFVTWFGWSVAALTTIVTGLFVATLLVVRPPTSAPAQGPAKHAHAEATALHTAADRLAAELRAKERGLSRAAHAHAHGGAPPTPRAIPAAVKGLPGRALSIGFYVNWDDASFPALKRALPHLDWVVPSWLSLRGGDMRLNVDVDQRALDMINTDRPGLPILPMIENAVDGVWDGPGLARMLADPAKRADRIAALVQFLVTNKFQGLTIDFETVPPAAQGDLAAFVRELSDAFKSHGLIVVLAVPFDDDAWDYTKYADITDYLLLMAYDQHWEEGEPGSIAGQDWFEETLDKRMAELDPDRTIVAIGNYGYDWVKGTTAKDVTFQEAMLEAQESEAEIDFDPAAENPHFSYVEDDGSTHHVWLLDAVTAFNQIHAADPFRPAGYALWRLGSEDPSIWSVMGRDYDAPAPDDLHTISPGADVSFDGVGEILRVESRPSPGARIFEIEQETGDIVDQTYVELPQAYIIQRSGHDPHKIALTFDDGPDPEWTPQILDILKEKGALATFFIIGENAESNPGLVSRILAEGHDVGNHSYTHPNLSAVPQSVAELEINATQRLFEADTGRSMRLFRAPYFGDAEPTTSDEIVPIDLAQSMGYLSVGLHIDPDDWQQPSADTIVQRVLDQVTSTDPDVTGQIVLLHDAGGDRSQTVAALPALIDALRARGYELVTVSNLAGISRDAAMPPLPPGAIEPLLDGAVFTTIAWVGSALSTFFVVAIWLGVARLLFLCVLAVVDRIGERKRIRPALPSPAPLVSVIVPAFNEAAVIRATVERLLGSDYAALEIVVVDDGSTDATGDIVREAFGGEARVSLLSLTNGGKARALNEGLAAAKGDVVIALDADTQFERNTISNLVRWFGDPRVGAVAGNAKVGNRINMVTCWQALEYITAQNLERRALSALGCITVVPGAVGAWRRDVVLGLGGFPLDTLAEDQDLTIAVRAGGWKILFDSEALAWTEAPDTFGGLAKQRFRWAYGTLQCLWKHGALLGRPRAGTLGMIGLPQVWLFQILLSLLSPFVDLLLIWQLVRSGIDYAQHGAQFDPTNLLATATYFAVFILVDTLAAVIAFALEKGERWSLLWWLVLQRFGYRQLIYFVVAKSLLRAATGPFVGWGKVERRASVKLRSDPEPLTDGPPAP